MEIRNLLEDVVKKSVSDVFIVAGSPVRLKLMGKFLNMMIKS